jgi:predicted DNA-binding transcriptional regulator YafY
LRKRGGRRSRTEERREAILAALRPGTLVRSAELRIAADASLREVYRQVAWLKAQGHPIRGEAGVGYMMRVQRNSHIAGGKKPLELSQVQVHEKGVSA